MINETRLPGTIVYCGKRKCKHNVKEPYGPFRRCLRESIKLSPDCTHFESKVLKYDAKKMREYLETAPDPVIALAILKLYERQTVAEQNKRTSLERNKRGFNKFDAKDMSSFALNFKAAKRYMSTENYVYHNSNKVKSLRPRVYKYSKQLAEIANHRIDTLKTNTTPSSIITEMESGVIYDQDGLKITIQEGR